jgi:hypothetical protein
MADSAFIRETELAILNAPFEGSGWHHAVDMISSACGSSAANLVGLGGPLGLSLNIFTGRNSDLAARYFATPELWGPSNWRINTAGAPMTVQHEAHHAAYRSVADTADYDDAVSDLDIPFGCQSALVADSRTFLGLALLRSRRDGPCDAEVLARFGKLIRDLHRAVRVELALQGEAAELLVGRTAGLASATLLLDRFGCLSALTPVAESLMEADGPVRLCGLAVQLRNHHDNKRFEKALHWMLNGDQEGAGDVFEMRVGCTAADPRGHWIARIVHLPQREHGLGFDPSIAVTFSAVAPHA